MPIMEIPHWIWGQLSYILAVMIGAALVAFRMPRRDKFPLRATISCAALIAAKMITDLLFIQGRSFDMRVTLNLCLSLMLYVMTSVAVVASFDCDIFAGLFCGTIGYSLQHIAHRFYMIYYYAMPQRVRWLDAAVLTVVTAVVYYLAYKLLLERSRYQNIVVDNKMQIIISTLFIMTTIFLDQFILNAAKEYITRVQILVMSISTCFLGVLLELSNMSSRNVELERDILSRLRKEEKEKLSYDKAVIDILNVKAHDLKHQLAAAEGAVRPEVAQELHRVISSYETTIHTGNTALDAVLVRKSRLAEEKGIKLTFLADGTKLSFMSDVDIYSFFGNILDNAIEATEKLENTEKRVISITVEAKGFFITVNAKNYFSGALEFSGGLPHTTKQDRFSHGFGMQSIQLLTEKYGGDLSIQTKEDMFILDILFPV